MGTHVYSRSLAGLLVLAMVVVLCVWGCGKTVSTGGFTAEPPHPEGCVVGSEGLAEEPGEGTVTISDEPRADVAEASVLGYSDPATRDAMATPALCGEGCSWEQPGDRSDGYSETVAPWMSSQGEERMEMLDEEPNPEMNEGDGFVGHDETPCEETPGMPAATEEECTPEQTKDVDNGSSETVAPGINGEDETMTDSDSVGVIPDKVGTTSRDDMSWMWMNDVRLIMSNWWQAIVAVENYPDMTPYEGYMASTSYGGDRDESGTDRELGPSP